MANVSQPKEVIPLWPDGAQGSEDWDWLEEELVLDNGLPAVRNVARPSLTVCRPDPAVANGTAVIVAPGGAWHFLAIEHEGWQVARWLNQQGVTAFVLKYRLIHTGEDFPEDMNRNMRGRGAMGRLMRKHTPLIEADARESVRLVRSRAAEFGVRPDRVGIMGFSAGGLVTALAALSPEPASRPDFAAPIYAAVFSKVQVPAGAPPLFITVANDDGLMPSSLKLYNAWHAAGLPAELHIYARGGHGFGMNPKNLPVDGWIERFGEWLRSEKFL